MTDGRRTWLLLAIGLGTVAALWLAWSGLVTRDAERRILRENRAAVLSPVRGLAQGYRSATRAEAAELLRSSLLKAATARGLLVEAIEIAPAQLAVSGPEPAVLGFAATVENARPLIRFSLWRLGTSTSGDRAIRLDARASALWEGP